MLAVSFLATGYSGTPARVPMEGSTFKQAATPWSMTNFKAPKADVQLWDGAPTPPAARPPAVGTDAGGASDAGTAAGIAAY